jgi:hypothetical protein
MPVHGSNLYPFVPSGPNFELAIEFFTARGFVPQWRDSGLAGLRFGGAYFLLQDIDVPEWQTNQMIVYEMDDLESYWNELSAKDLPERFAGTKLKPPTDYPWGRELHIIDPGGVCWHVRQARLAS